MSPPPSGRRAPADGDPAVSLHAAPHARRMDGALANQNAVRPRGRCVAASGVPASTGSSFLRATRQGGAQDGHGLLEQLAGGGVADEQEARDPRRSKPRDRGSFFRRAASASCGSRRLRIVLIVAPFRDGTSLLCLGGTRAAPRLLRGAPPSHGKAAEISGGRSGSLVHCRR